MMNVVSISVPTWEEGTKWVTDNLPDTESSDARRGAVARKAFTSKYHEKVVGSHEEIIVFLGRDVGNNDAPLIHIGVNITN